MLETAWESRWLPDHKKCKSERLTNGDVAQLGEHLPCKQGVKGSNPSISMIAMNMYSYCHINRIKFIWAYSSAG